MESLQRLISDYADLDKPIEQTPNPEEAKEESYELNLEAKASIVATPTVEIAEVAEQEPPAFDYKRLAKQVFDSQNKVRVNSRYLVPQLEESLKFFKGKILYRPGEVGLITDEGPKAYQEAIHYLNNKAPKKKALKWSDILAKAAEDHANDIGENGLLGHEGSDGNHASERIRKHGNWLDFCGENISFAQDKGDRIMIQLIVDDAVKSRGHRGNIFETPANFVGVGAAAHSRYGICVVIAYAGDVAELDEGGGIDINNMNIADITRRLNIMYNNSNAAEKQVSPVKSPSKRVLTTQKSEMPEAKPVVKPAKPGITRTATMPVKETKMISPTKDSTNKSAAAKALSPSTKLVPTKPDPNSTRDLKKPSIQVKVIPGKPTITQKDDPHMPANCSHTETETTEETDNGVVKTTTIKVYFMTDGSKKTVKTVKERAE